MILPSPYPIWYSAITVVFFVWPADALAAQIITTAYATPVIDRIHIPVISPQRFDHGRPGRSECKTWMGLDNNSLRRSILDNAPGIYEERDIQARQFFCNQSQCNTQKKNHWLEHTLVLCKASAAEIRHTKETTPVTAPRRVVCRTENPNEFIISEYWLVIPLAISCDQAWRKKSHVLGSLSASTNLGFISDGSFY